MKDSKRFINGKCRYCGLDEKHCSCGIAEGESCQIGCGEGCSCAQSHSHERESFEWKEFIPVAIAAIFLIGSIFLSGTVQIVVRLAAYLLAGYEVLIRAVTGFAKGRFFDENVLMAVATIGAITLGDYAEAAAVMIFYGVGEGLQEAAVRSSRKRITDAVELHPDTARRISDGGEQSVVKPEEIAAGESILVKPGERVPLDGVVVAGESLLDVSMLNGEPKPQLAKADSTVQAGAVNTNGPLTIRVTSIASESSTSRLLRAVEDATKA